jgi:hypothetical protein
MNPSTVLGLVGSLTTLVVLFEMMRRHRLREKYAVFWSVIAVATVVVALFPGILDTAASLLGVQVPANLLFFVASMLLLLISVQHSHELSRLEDHGRTLAEEVALLRLSVEVLTEEQGRPSTDE